MNALETSMLDPLPTNKVTNEVPAPRMAASSVREYILDDVVLR